MKNYFIFFIFSIFTSQIIAQETAITQKKFTAHNKGKIFISWGGNRGKYSESDVRFWGDGYDFTIQNMVAQDKPKGYTIDYINPARMTIPQTNFKLGYYFNDHYSISIGWDHMKYVMKQNQTAIINGNINLPASDPGFAFNGIYSSTPVYLIEDFLEYEHTDGLNYVNTELARTDDISTLFNLKNTDKFQINCIEGLGFGLLYPKTNTTLLSRERHDDFHISGYGASLKAGINFTFYKYFFIQGDIKGGYINMPDIRTTKNDSDRASQEFFFFQSIISLGGIFKV